MATGWCSYQCHCELGTLAFSAQSAMQLECYYCEPGVVYTHSLRSLQACLKRGGIQSIDCIQIHWFALVASCRYLHFTSCFRILDCCDFTQANLCHASLNPSGFCRSSGRTYTPLRLQCYLKARATARRCMLHCSPCSEARLCADHLDNSGHVLVPGLHLVVLQVPHTRSQTPAKVSLLLTMTWQACSSSSRNSCTCAWHCSLAGVLRIYILMCVSVSTLLLQSSETWTIP